MNEFNTMVLNVAVIVFIIALVIVGYILYFSIRNSSFPPFDTQCPTYYRLDASGQNCKFDESTYSSSITYPSLAVAPTSGDNCVTVPVSTFNGNGFSRDEVLCAKNRWARRCGVFWDGVTNNQNACMNSNSSLFFG